MSSDRMTDEELDRLIASEVGQAKVIAVRKILATWRDTELGDEEDDTVERGRE